MPDWRMRLERDGPTLETVKKSQVRAMAAVGEWRLG